jgi:hypothetical protein
MSPLIHDALKYGLVAAFFAAFATAMWTNTRMMHRLQKRKSELGNPWFDLRPTFAAWNGIEFPVFIAAVIGMVVIGLGLTALG